MNSREQIHERAIARHRERVKRKIERDQASVDCDRDEWEWIEREYRRELAELPQHFETMVVSTNDF